MRTGSRLLVLGLGEEEEMKGVMICTNTNFGCARIDRIMFQRNKSHARPVKVNLRS